MRAKIEKYLKSKDIKNTYRGTYTYHHFGGRSFANNGKYTGSVYDLETKDGKQFVLQDKLTGRSEFRLVSIHGNILALGFSQDQFIEQMDVFVAGGGLNSNG